MPRRPFSTVWMYLARGSPTRPSREAISAVDSPQTKAPPPRLMRMSKAKPLPRMFSPSRPQARASRDGLLQVLHRQRVLVAHVDVALRGADGVGADDHALQHRVGIAFHDRAVHERARVAFVAVADHVLGPARRLPAAPPLAPRGEAAAAAAAQAGNLHFADDLLGLHGEEGLGQGGIAAHGDVVLDAGRVDAPVVLQHDALLHGVEGDFAGRAGLDPGARVFVQQALHHPAAQHGLAVDLLHVRLLHPLVEDVARLDHHDGAALAQAVAAHVLAFNYGLFSIRAGGLGRLAEHLEKPA